METDKRLSEESERRRSFNDDRQPQAGFVFPKVGDTIRCVADWNTPVASKTVVLPRGAQGTVTGLRMPGTFKQVQGYIGCVVFFEELREHYFAGVVIPWDEVSDPTKFSFSSC